GEVTPPRKTLAQILEALPAAPGVYIMKDGRGKPIYIGKAAVLRNRVRQYFQPASGDSRDFVPLLDGIVADIETVVTSNEKEALLLENTLIKRHQPRFNVKLTDDKNFLVLRLDPDGEWPRLEVVRRIGHDQAYYFGPYHSATSCRETLRVVNRHFQLRTCTDHVLHNRRRPCLQYQIKRCPAPCVLPVARESYAEQIRDVRLFLDGKSDELLDRLRARMKEAAARQEFEIAADIRDQIRALEVTLEKQRVVSTDFVDQDVIGYYRQGIALEIAVLSIRNGQLNGSRQFSFTNQEFPDAELISSFVGLYYDLGAPPPDEVLLPVEIDDAAVKAEWLSDRRAELGGRRRKVEVSTPQRGDRRRLVELANKNAAASFASRRNARADVELALGKLMRRLKLPKLPRVIECYDVSHLQGFATVASMVVFVDGRPDKARYRTYKVRAPARASGRTNDDFASMYEVLSRRFRRARAATDPTDPWKLPDLIVVDGGKGQLAMALAAARDVGVAVGPGAEMSIVALAKERDDMAPLALEDPPAEEDLAAPAAASSPAAAPAEPVPPAVTAPSRNGKDDKKDDKKGDTHRPDRVFLPNVKDPIPIRPASGEMFILQQLRDEAHRFAVSFHRGQRRRLTLRSVLSTIPGIGPGRQRQLLRHFGSVKRVRQATIDELASVSGMSRTAAEAVFEHFARQPEEAPAPEARATAEELAIEDAFTNSDGEVLEMAPDAAVSVPPEPGAA
ncbi:MAG TPA: excinuclease ABC subunit UvrC, partial [Polyangia bacterium]|nr:excinuclease ABC subunit UvrC [Polyangia bacterium]